MINFYYELVALNIKLEKDPLNEKLGFKPSLFELLTLEKEFILDIFKNYWNNDLEMNQLEWFLDYLEKECEIAHNLGKYFWRKYQDNKYLQASPKNKIGKCIGCIHFVKNNEDLKKCSCEVKSGYITQNASRTLYCQDYSVIEE